MYQPSGGMNRNVVPTGPYTVLTRDPYGYDELYGSRLIAIARNPPSQDDQNIKLLGVSR